MSSLFLKMRYVKAKSTLPFGQRRLFSNILETTIFTSLLSLGRFLSWFAPRLEQYETAASYISRPLHHLLHVFSSDDTLGLPNEIDEEVKNHVDDISKASDAVFKTIERTRKSQQPMSGSFKSSLFNKGNSSSEECFINRTNTENPGIIFHDSAPKLYASDHRRCFSE